MGKYINLIMFYYLFNVGVCIAQIIPVSAQVPTASSSSLPQSKSLNYLSNNLIDLSSETAWVEGVKGNGVNEWVAVYVGDLEELKDGGNIIVSILPGYTKSETVYRNNGKPTLLQIDLYINNLVVDSKKLKCPIFPKQDEYCDCFASFSTSSLTLKKNSLTEGTVWVKVIIKEAVKGQKWDDIAISEITCIVKSPLPNDFVNMFNNFTKAIKLKEHNIVKSLTSLPLEIIYKQFDILSYYQGDMKSLDMSKCVSINSKKIIYAYPFSACADDLAVFEYEKDKWILKKLSSMPLVFLDSYLE